MDGRVQAPPQNRHSQQQGPPQSMQQQQQQQNGPTRGDYSMMNGGPGGVDHSGSVMLALTDRRGPTMGPSIGMGGLTGRLPLIQGQMSAPGIRSGIPPPQHTSHAPSGLSSQMQSKYREKRRAVL